MTARQTTKKRKKRSSNGSTKYLRGINPSFLISHMSSPNPRLSIPACTCWRLAAPSTHPPLILFFLVGCSVVVVFTWLQGPILGGFAPPPHWEEGEPPQKSRKPAPLGWYRNAPPPSHAYRHSTRPAPDQPPIKDRPPSARLSVCLTPPPPPPRRPPARRSRAPPSRAPPVIVVVVIEGGEQNHEQVRPLFLVVVCALTAFSGLADTEGFSTSIFSRFCCVFFCWGVHMSNGRDEPSEIQSKRIQRRAGTTGVAASLDRINRPSHVLLRTL